MAPVSNFSLNKQSPILTTPVSTPSPLLQNSPHKSQSISRNVPPALRPLPVATPVVAAANNAQRAVQTIQKADATQSANTGMFGTIAKAFESGKEVRELFALGTQLMARGATERQTIQSIGSYAQKVIRGELSREAATEVLTQVGVNQALIPHINTNDLIKSGYEYLTSGFDKKVFFDSIENAASKNLQSAANTATGAIATEAGSAGVIGSKVLGAVGAAYSAYEVFSNWGKGGTIENGITSAVSGATAGAYLGSCIVPGFGTVIGGAIGGAVGLIGGMLKAGKHEDQKARDTIRDALIQAGITDEQWQLTLSDGSKYDIGKDGGFTLTSLDGTERGAYDIDFSHPLAGEVVGMANSLAALVTGGDPKLTSDFCGYFANAALSNAQTLDDAKRNLQAIFSTFKASPDQVVQGISGLVQQGKVTAEVGQAYVNGFATIFDVEQVVAQAA